MREHASERHPFLRERVIFFFFSCHRSGRLCLSAIIHQPCSAHRSPYAIPHLVPEWLVKEYQAWPFQESVHSCI
jgi:hypothetical protein